jgi:uncharacterized protein YdaU (DUF1376 family)
MGPPKSVLLRLPVSPQRGSRMVMHYYPHHIGDFNAATRHLSRLERSIYRDLIELYYETEAPISIDLERVARRIVATSPQERAAMVDVLNEFFTPGPEGWSHKRCEEELAKYRRMSAGGKAGAEQRWSKGKPSQTDAPPIAPLCPPYSPPNGEGNGEEMGGRMPTKNQEPRTKNQGNTEPSVLVPQGGAPDCPHAEIVELYHDCCPTLPRCMVLSPKRQALMRSRWREVWADLKFDRLGGLQWFREFFESVQRSDFLTGRAKSDRIWTADLEWLMLPSNFVKVAEGRYNREK